LVRLFAQLARGPIAHLLKLTSLTPPSNGERTRCLSVYRYQACPEPPPEIFRGSSIKTSTRETP